MVNDSDIVDFQIENKGVNLSIKKAEAMEEKIQVRTQNYVRKSELRHMGAGDAGGHSAISSSSELFAHSCNS